MNEYFLKELNKISDLHPSYTTVDIGLSNWHTTYEEFAEKFLNDKFYALTIIYKNIGKKEQHHFPTEFGELINKWNDKRNIFETFYLFEKDGQWHVQKGGNAGSYQRGLQTICNYAYALKSKEQSFDHIFYNQMNDTCFHAPNTLILQGTFGDNYTQGEIDKSLLDRCTMIDIRPNLDMPYNHPDSIEIIANVQKEITYEPSN
jgi:hypothetical protein